jgi:hypothetical protein
METEREPIQNDDVRLSDNRTLADITRIHYWNRCLKAYYIDPGPPPVHRPLFIDQLNLWVSLVVCLFRILTILSYSHAEYRN